MNVSLTLVATVAGERVDPRLCLLPLLCPPPAPPLLPFCQLRVRRPLTRLPYCRFPCRLRPFRRLRLEESPPPSAPPRLGKQNAQVTFPNFIFKNVDFVLTSARFSPSASWFVGGDFSRVLLFFHRLRQNCHSVLDVGGRGRLFCVGGARGVSCKCFRPISLILCFHHRSDAYP